MYNVILSTCFVIAVVVLVVGSVLFLYHLLFIIF